MTTILIKRIFSSVFLIALLLMILNLKIIFFNIFLILIFFICFYEWFKLVNTNFFRISGLFFFLFSFYSAYEIKMLDENNLFFYYTILITIGSDIGGYIFGKFFKGPKLTSISPNKTYSGAFGSFIMSLILVVFFFKTFDVTILNFDIFSLEFIFLTLILSSISQLGDLIISFFKRISNVKDTGKLIPGHGGFLDRLDGSLFVFPFFYIIINTFF